VTWNEVVIVYFKVISQALPEGKSRIKVVAVLKLHSVKMCVWYSGGKNPHCLGARWG
jgi:hypothetical protein